MVLILLIQIFDKEDKYFVVQIIILALVVLYAIISLIINYKNKKSNG